MYVSYVTEVRRSNRCRLRAVLTPPPPPAARPLGRYGCWIITEGRPTRFPRQWISTAADPPSPNATGMVHTKLLIVHRFEPSLHTKAATESFSSASSPAFGGAARGTFTVKCFEGGSTRFPEAGKSAAIS